VTELSSEISPPLQAEIDESKHFASSMVTTLADFGQRTVDSMQQAFSVGACGLKNSWQIIYFQKLDENHESSSI